LTRRDEADDDAAERSPEFAWGAVDALTGADVADAVGTRTAATSAAAIKLLRSRLFTFLP
jgi:hypothetical protein